MSGMRETAIKLGREGVQPKKVKSNSYFHWCIGWEKRLGTLFEAALPLQASPLAVQEFLWAICKAPPHQSPRAQKILIQHTHIFHCQPGEGVQRRRENKNLKKTKNSQLSKLCLQQAIKGSSPERIPSREHGTEAAVSAIKQQSQSLVLQPW